MAYVTAVAARAGCQVGKLDIDKQSVDATIRPISGRRVSIDLQLKATSSAAIKDGKLEFDLPVKNYDDLRDECSTAPHYLVVLVLDGDDMQWLESDDDRMLLRRCAYWHDLRGEPSTSNIATVRVSIPLCRRFDVAALRKMVDEACKLAGAPGDLS